jgi:hypothetical protein
LQQLAEREPPLARAMAREPGAREVRYVHLLSAVADKSPGTLSEPSRGTAHAPETIDDGVADRIANLEDEVAQLRARIASLEEKLTQLAG